MVDTIQQISASPSLTTASAKPSVTSSAPVSSGISVSAPVAANSSSAPAKKAAAKKTVKKKTASSLRAKSSVKKVKKVSARSTAAAKKVVKDNVKTIKSFTSSSPFISADSSKMFDSMMKSSEAFFNFKPNTPSMEKLMTQSKNQMEKLAQDAASFGRDGIEACIKSSSLWMKGYEDIVRTAMSLAQSSAEKQGKFVKEALASKTLNEWAEVQNKIAQTNFDDFMSGATKISELSVKVLSEASEPVNAQASKAVKKVTEAMAA